MGVQPRELRSGLRKRRRRRCEGAYYCCCIGLSSAGTCCFMCMCTVKSSRCCERDDAERGARLWWIRVHVTRKDVMQQELLSSIPPTRPSRLRGINRIFAGVLRSDSTNLTRCSRQWHDTPAIRSIQCAPYLKAVHPCVRSRTTSSARHRARSCSLSTHRHVANHPERRCMILQQPRELLSLSLTLDRTIAPRHRDTKDQ